MKKMGPVVPVADPGGEKHEICAAVFGNHLSYDLFLQGRGGGMAPAPPVPLLSWARPGFVCVDPLLHMIGLVDEFWFLFAKMIVAD